MKDQEKETEANSELESNSRAKPTKSFETSADRYLCFSLGHEEYAIPLLSVKEVIAMPEIAPVPQSPSYFLGIMNLHGQVISVIDLRMKLSIKPNEKSEKAIIVCDLSPNCIGVVVDSVNSVKNPKSTDIKDKPDMTSHKNSDYIVSVFNEDNKIILIIDISKTLNVGDQKQISKQTEKTEPRKVT